MVTTPSGASTTWVRFEWMLLVLCVGILGLRTIPSAFGTLQTDFPNYYLAARLATEGADTAHLYEWRWLARQKDHHEIDRSVIGLVPITPFSTLAIAPLADLEPLTAKRIWLGIQLAMLVPILYGLRAITGQPLRRIGLLVLGYPPLHRNLLYGQFYILLAAVLVGACWAYQRGHRRWAGVLVALATALKLFPVAFYFYFARKRDWRALPAAVLAGAVCVAISIAVFGWEVHRTYILQILPWTLRGEGLPPFALGSQSLSTLLHCLLLYEPQWNPKPWFPSPFLFATLQAVLPMLLFAPALLLCDERDRSEARAAVEWSAILVATLAVSTIPASYNFTLLVLPAVVLIGRLEDQQSRLVWLAVALYAGIGLPSGWNIGPASGPGVLLQTPRLYLLLALAGLFYAAMGTIALRETERRRVTLFAGGALAAFTIFQAASGVRHQRNLGADFAYRVPDAAGSLLASSPAWNGGDVMRIAMQPAGYRLLENMNVAPASVPFSESSAGPDEIAFAANGGRVLVEIAGPHSTIHSLRDETFRIVDAESPALSADGRYAAYLRVTNGRGALYVRAYDGAEGVERRLTPSSINVEQAAFLPGGSLIVAGLVRGSTGSRLLRIAEGREPEVLSVGEARYPAVSPNGRWLAFSRFRRGNWHLALQDLRNGSVRDLADAECNTMEPAWEADSKTILYSSDCGRALWFTAISRRQVVP